jgi:hypothetical protein
MSCTGRVRIEKKHHAANAKFDAARKQLQERIGVSSREEYMALHRQVDVAWEELAYARAMLDNHIREHCYLAQQGVGSEQS